MLLAASFASFASVVGTAELRLDGIVAPSLGPRLFDDLGRSPLWHLAADRDGALVASLRVVTRDANWDAGQWMPSALGAGAVSNGALRDGDGSYLAIQVRGRLPPDAVVADPAAPSVSLPIHGSALDGNAWSLVAWPLGAERWLVVREQGRSPARGATRDALAVAMTELARIASLPESYLARDVYADVFASLGGPGLARYPDPVGQDRDGLGIVLETRARFDYEGVRVHVWDEAVCHGECTVGYRQDEKAERLGHPPPGDLAFALAEDCAVMLDAAGSRRYGTFSGSGAFDAEIRWTDAGARTLGSSRGPFRGWER